jgi:outer membrane protein TolC
MKHSTLTLLVLLSSVGFAQQALTETAFLSMVKQNHPLIKISDLQPKYGDAYLIKAKGGFDPKIAGTLNQKYFDGKQYYSVGDYGIKYPTWYGLTVKTGVESNRGTYLDPQAKTPSGGLFYGGIGANLGQGMLIDQRRADLWSAKINLQSSEEERRLQVNKLLYETGYAYWDWFLAFHAREILQDAYDVALERFIAVQQTAILGDRAFIDTVEAGLQVQQRLSLLRDAEANYKEKCNAQSTYLWSEQQEPLVLSETTQPTSQNDWIASAEIPFQTDSLLNQHPYLKITSFKVDMLEIDRKLKADRLKPVVQLNYNILNEPVNYNPFSDLDITDYKWGFSIEMPLFLRKERGEFKLANLKIEETQLNLVQLKAQLNLKINNARIDLANSIAQLEIYQRSVTDSKALLDAERNMFENGESSLFLINMRELNYIQSQLKYLEWQAKNKQIGYSLGFATATLF